MQTQGNISQWTCPYTPQQNGVPERKNRHLLGMTRTLLHESSVPSRFWAEAISTAVHLINRIPSSKLQHQTPYFRMHGIHPSYNHLHTFKCVCYVHLPLLKRNKLTAQSVKCAFLGYAMNQKGFLSYDPSICRIRTSRNVVFVEN